MLDNRRYSAHGSVKHREFRSFVKVPRCLATLSKWSIDIKPPVCESTR